MIQLEMEQETFIEEKQEINTEELKKQVRDLHQSFTKLKEERKKRELKWIATLKGASSGELLGSDIKKLMSGVLDLEDLTYPTLVWESYSEKTALVKSDMVEIIPRGKHQSTKGDLMLADMVAEFFKQKNEHEESNFVPALEAAIWSATAINLGIVHYCWHRETKKQKQYQNRFNEQSGTYNLEILSEQDELDYQGHKATYINPFDFYFDTKAARIDNLYKLDTFHTEIVDYDELCQDARFNPEDGSYFNVNNVIYRDNLELKELKTPYVELTADEIKQRQLLKEHSPRIKRSVRLVTCYRDKIKIGEDIYKNVVVIYALGNDNTNAIPLLIEYNPNPFNWKPYVYIVPRKIPGEIYAQSQTELAFNKHAMASYYQGVEIITTAQALFGTEFYPLDFEKSTADSSEKFRETLNTIGRQVGYDNTAYRGMGADILSPQRDRALKILPLLTQQKQVQRQEEADAHADLMAADTSQSTATGIKSVSAKRSLLQEKFRAELQRALQRFIKLALQDMKRFFTDEKIMTDLSDDEMKGLMNDNVTPVHQQETLGNGIPIVAQLDPVTQTKVMELKSFMLTEFEGEVRITLKEEDTGLAMEEITRMFDLAERTQSKAVGLLAINRYVQVTDMPLGKELLKAVEQEIEQANQPDPAQQAMQQAQIEAQSAKSNKENAQTQQIQVDTAKTSQDMAINESALAQLGIA